ncbi:MAG: HD domain-containing phosphohydrolase [Desulfarculaceae bacterium]|jgi:uncharacterized membrane protein affecting hemolysin expression
MIEPAKKIRFFNTVKFKLTAFFCGAICLLALTSGYVLFNRLEAAYHNELTSRAELMVQNLAINAAPLLVANDKLQMSVLVATLQKSPELRYAAVLDHMGIARMHSDVNLMNKRLDAEPKEPGLAFGQAEKILQISKPVFYNGRQVGEVRAGIDASGVLRRIAELRGKLIAGLGIFTLISCFIFIWIIKHFLRPVADLTQAAERVSLGDLKAKAQVRGADEFEKMALVFNQMTTNLDRASRQIHKGYLQAVQALAAAVEAKDTYTRGHCDRVAMMAETIARKLGLDEKTIYHLRLAGQLHDLGKIGVSKDILSKPGSLKPEEFEAMAKHPDIACQILMPAEFLAPVREIILAHHEHYDGKGYPNGLAGEEICLAGRILCLADAYDAMISDRPYRLSLPESMAVSIINDERGKHFDPQVVDAFLQVRELLKTAPLPDSYKHGELPSSGRLPQVQKGWEDAPDAGLGTKGNK